eukprot:986796-Prymnesium_polylepis.1
MRRHARTLTRELPVGAASRHDAIVMHRSAAASRGDARRRCVRPRKGSGRTSDPRGGNGCGRAVARVAAAYRREVEAEVEIAKDENGGARRAAGLLGDGLR